MCLTQDKGMLQTVGKKMHRSVLKDKVSVLGALCSQTMGGDWKRKRPPGVFRKYSTIRHMTNAEKTFQQNWNFKSLGQEACLSLSEMELSFKLQRILF